MSKIQSLSEKDVLWFEEYQPFRLSKTSRFDEFKEKLEERIGDYDQDDKILLESGIECEILQPGSSDWKKGKIRIRLEFVINSECENSDLDEFRDSETQS